MPGDRGLLQGVRGSGGRAWAGDEVRDIAAIVEPAIDIRRLARDIAREHIALQDTDRKVEVNAAQGESLRERQTQHRLEMGRLLIEAKRQVPHGGWLPFLEKLVIPARTATEWMDEFKSAHREDYADLPKSQKSRRAERAASNPQTRVQDQDDEPDETQPDPPAAKTGPEAPSLDIDRELSKIRNRFCDFAAAVPAARKQIAHELHETARLIESMQ